MSNVQALYRAIDADVPPELPLDPSWVVAPENAPADEGDGAPPWHTGFEAAAGEIASGLWTPGRLLGAFVLAVVLSGVLWAIAVGMGLARLA